MSSWADALPGRLSTVTCREATLMCKHVDGCPHAVTREQLPPQQFLVTGCGASGTLSMTARLQHAGIKVKHETESKGGDGMVAWMGRCARMLPADDPLLQPALPNIVNCWPATPGPATHCNGARVLYRRVLQQVRHPMAWMRSWLPLMQHEQVNNRSVCSHQPDRGCWSDYDKFYNGQPPWRLGHHNAGVLVNWLLINMFTWPHALLDADASGPGAHFAPREEEARLAARHYVSWNAMLERVADARFQVETTSLHHVCVLAGVPDPERCARSEANLSHVGQTAGSGSVNSHTHFTPAARKAQVQAHADWAALRALDAPLEAELWAMAQRYGYGREPPMQHQIQH